MLEYPSPSGEMWRIEDSDAMLGCFQLDESQLTDWHEYFVSEHKAWVMATRLFGIAPVILPTGKTDADYEQWKPKEIAVHLGIAQSDIDRELDRVTRSFRFAQNYKDSNMKAEDVIGEENASLAGLSDPEAVLHEVMSYTPEERRRILTAHGFGFLITPDSDDPTDETDPSAHLDEQIFVLTRIPEMEHFLNDEQGRILAQEAIMMELEIKDTSERLALSRRKTGRDKLLSKQHNELSKELGKLRKDYSDLMVKLGAVSSGNPSHRRRAEFADSLGGLIKQVKEYKADPNNQLIDGMSTAAEIEVALREHVERPPQYRGDKALEIYFARMSHNLWDRDYPGQPVTRAVCRALKAGMQHASEILRGDRPLTSLHDGKELADIIDDARSNSATTAPAEAGLLSGPPESDATNQPPPGNPFFGHPGGGDDLAV